MVPNPNYQAASTVSDSPRHFMKENHADDSPVQFEPHLGEKVLVNLLENRQNSLLDDLPPIIDTSEKFKELIRVKRDFKENETVSNSQLDGARNLTNGTEGKESEKYDEDVTSAVDEMIAMLHLLKRITRDTNSRNSERIDNLANAAAITTPESNITRLIEHINSISNETNLHIASKVTNGTNLDANNNIPNFTTNLAMPTKEDTDETTDHAILISNETNLYNFTNYMRDHGTNKNVSNTALSSSTNKTQQSREILDLILSSSLNVTDLPSTNTNASSLEVKRSAPRDHEQTTNMTSSKLALNETTTKLTDNKTEQFTFSKGTTEHQLDSATRTIAHHINTDGSKTISPLENDSFANQSKSIKTMNKINKDKNTTNYLIINTMSPSLLISNQTILNQSNFKKTPLHRNMISNRIQNEHTLVTRSNYTLITKQNQSHFDFNSTELDLKKINKYYQKISENQTTQESSTLNLKKETATHQFEHFNNTEYHHKTVISETFSNILSKNSNHTDKKVESNQIKPDTNQIDIDTKVTSFSDNTTYNGNESVAAQNRNMDIISNVSSVQNDLDSMIIKEKKIVNVISTEGRRPTDSVSIEDKLPTVAADYELDITSYHDKNDEITNNDIISDEIINEEMNRWIVMQSHPQFETGKDHFTTKESFFINRKIFLFCSIKYHNFNKYRHLRINRTFFFS